MTVLGRLIDQLLGDAPIIPPCTGKVHFLETRDEFKALVTSSTLTIAATAKMYGISAFTVKRWRKAAGVTVYKQYPIPYKREIAAAPGTLRSVAEKYGVPLVTVHRWRKQYS